MIYECPQCSDVFQTDVLAPVCDNCGGPMRETVGDFDPETGALWHVWGGKMQRECLRDTVTDAHHAVTVLNGMRGGGNMARAVLRLCALAATPAPATTGEWPARSLVMLALYKLLGVPGTESVREDLQRAYDLMGADRDAEFKTYAKSRATAVRIASEMQAWAEKKMTGNGSSRIGRTCIREWAEQLLGDA